MNLSVNGLSCWEHITHTFWSDSGRKLWPCSCKQQTSCAWIPGSPCGVSFGHLTSVSLNISALLPKCVAWWSWLKKSWMLERYVTLKIPQQYNRLLSRWLFFIYGCFMMIYAFIVCRDRAPVNWRGSNERSPRRERRTLGQICFCCWVSEFGVFRSLSKHLFKYAAALWLVVSTVVLMQFQNDGKVSKSLCLM